MNGVTTAFWGMTINNYDETDLALVQNGYPDHCREIVHTLEVGEEGTPHIQAWVKLQRQQRLSFVKKLFPRGHFKALTSDEYIANTKAYAQKLDDTAAAAAVHRFNDPLKTIETTMRKVIERMMDVYEDVEELDYARRAAERDMVLEDYKFAKIFVSATYKQMWKQFGHEMYQCVFDMRHTHTHTHTDEKFSQSVDIPTHVEQTEDDSEEQASSEDEGDEGSGSSEDEGYDTSGSSGDCSEDAGQEDSGQESRVRRRNQRVSQQRRRSR